MTEHDICGYHRVSRLTKPLISMSHMSWLCCKVVGPPYKADFELGEGEGRGKPTVCPVVNLSDGEEGLLICNTIILSCFLFYGEDLINKVFELTSGSIVEGKGYRKIDIFEMQENGQGE